MYDVLDIAMYVVNYSNDNDQWISNFKLQSVLYFIQAQFLVYENKPCFKDDIEVIDYGVIIPKVYRCYRKYENCPISYQKQYIKLGKYDSIWDATFREYNEVQAIIFKEDKRIIETMVDRLKKYSSSELLEIVRNQDPWLYVWREYGCTYRRKWNRVIPNDKIRDFFKEEN